MTALERLREQIVGAAKSGRALQIRGGGSKDFYGQAPVGEPLETRDYAGIVSYEPTELVISARSGTPLAELEDELSRENSSSSKSSYREAHQPEQAAESAVRVSRRPTSRTILASEPQSPATRSWADPFEPINTLEASDTER